MLEGRGSICGVPHRHILTFLVRVSSLCLLVGCSRIPESRIVILHCLTMRECREKLVEICQGPGYVYAFRTMPDGTSRGQCAEKDK